MPTYPHLPIDTYLSTPTYPLLKLWIEKQQTNFLWWLTNNVFFLFYRISIYRRYLWILITMPRGKTDAQQSLPGSGASNGSFSSIESKELLYFYSNFSNTDEVYCKIKKYSYNYIDKLPGSKGFHLYKCCVFFIFILSYQRD